MDSDDLPDIRDEIPTKQQKMGKTADEKNVRFKLGGQIDDFSKVPQASKTQSQKGQEFDQPKALKKQLKMDELDVKKANLTPEDIVSESKSNQKLIYKFMKKGFNALSAEELACTMVNPTFSIDFKRNAHEDWNMNYQAKVVEKLQRCKFHMHWFIKQASASGYDDQHDNFMKLVEKGDMEKCFVYLRKNDMAQVLSSVEQSNFG